MQQLWNANKDRGVVVLGVNIGERTNPQAAAKGFQDKHRLTYPILVDAKGEAARAYGVSGIPHNVIIDPNGVVRYVKAGFAEAEVQQRLSQVIQATPPTAGAAGGGPSVVAVLLGGWKLDCEAGRIVAPDSTNADLLWEQTSSTQRKLVPLGGAQIANLGVMSEDEFKNLSAQKIQEAKLADADIDGSDGGNRLEAGTVLLVRTRNQRLIKMRVGASDRSYIPQGDNPRYNVVLTMAVAR